MGKISEFFNFDDVGSKIKNLAKYSCWITILLIWIAAPISFIVLVSDNWTAYLWWIPLVSAVVGPFLVWIGSWIMYAFGQLVEDTYDITNQNAVINRNVKIIAQPIIDDLEKKHNAEDDAKRKAKEDAKREAEEKTEHHAEEKKEWSAIANFSVTEKGTIICAQCKFEQPGNRKVCWHCAAKFE